jgi:hypothetical protein
MNLPKRQRLLLILAGAVVALFALDSVVIEPLIKSWQERSAAMAKLEKNLAAGRSLIARADRTGKLWADMKAGAFPADASQAEQELLSAFDGWGRFCGIEVGSIRPQWKRGANDRYSLLECRVDATGSLSNLSRFLYEVERSPLAIRVDTVELVARDDGGQRLALGLLVTGLRLSPLEGKP